MTARGLGGVLLALVVGVGLGVGAAYALRPDPVSSGAAAPVPAESPSMPTDDPFAPDIDYPKLGEIEAFDSHRIGNRLQTWEYVVPAGWVPYAVSNGPDRLVAAENAWRYDEVRFRPPDEDLVGGYSLRVKAIDNHATPLDEVNDKVADFERIYEDVTVLDRTDETVFFSFRAENDTLRYNFWHWFVAPDSDEATLEMSIAGRAVDQEGMHALFDQFADQARPVED